MKATIIKSSKDLPKFTPVTIELVIETKEDLATLWHRANIAVDTVKENSHDYDGVPVDLIYNAGSLWTTLNGIRRDKLASSELNEDK